MPRARGAVRRVRGARTSAGSADRARGAVRGEHRPVQDAGGGVSRAREDQRGLD